MVLFFNYRFFRAICSNTAISFKTSIKKKKGVYWLSHGKMLVQIFQMRQETLLFPNNEILLAKISSDITWSPYHPYLAKILSKGKKLHLSISRCCWIYWKLKIKCQQSKQSFKVFIGNANKIYLLIWNFGRDRVIWLILETSIVKHRMDERCTWKLFSKE